MQKEEVIENLQKFNDWRRGKPPYDELGSKSPISAIDLGKTVDEAIELLITT